jgi:uncharacterized protein (TIGR02284 family)
MSASASAAIAQTGPVKTLERLLAVCEDGVLGYRRAAAAIDDPRLRAPLAAEAARREEVASVLAYALVDLGTKPSHHGSLEGAIHRRWVDALAASRAGGAHAILKECLRGERATIYAFAEALAEDLPYAVRTVVQSQLGRVLEAAETVSNLERFGD